jgi:hypothetical protein
LQPLTHHSCRFSLRKSTSYRVVALFAVIAAIVLSSPGCASPAAPATIPPAPAQPTMSPPGGNPWTSDEYIEKTYEWKYWRFDEIVWKLTLRIPTGLYEDYRSRPRPTTGDYAVFAADDGDRALLAELGAKLQAYAANLGLDDYETIHFIATFVQQLPYELDIDTTGFDDYGRYPIETLVEDGGDCEDTAILLGKLMDILGYDVVLVRLPDHMALGVREMSKFVGTYYSHDDVRYFYLETTGLAGRIGMVPDDYTGQAAYIYDFSPRPILTHTWNGQHNGNNYEMTVLVENHGAAAVEGCTVRVGFDAGDDRMWNAVDSAPFTLAAQSAATLTLSLEVPAYDHTRLLVFIVHEGFALDRSESRWFDEQD